MKAICIMFTSALALGTSAVSAAQTGISSPAEQRCVVSESNQKLLRKVAEFASRNTTLMPLTERFSQALGLNGAGSPFVQKQAIMKDADGISRHVFASDANGSDKYLIVRLGGRPVADFFLTDGSFALLAAAKYENGTLTPVNIASSAVCARFQNEVSAWANAKLENEPEN